VELVSSPVAALANRRRIRGLHPFEDMKRCKFGIVLLPISLDVE
jgi:hypothetical protein